VAHTKECSNLEPSNMELFPPPSVDDNEARYCLFLSTPGAEQTPEQLYQAAEKQCNNALAFATQQTQGFLWHRHRFHLQVTRSTRGFYILSGSTSVGDAIQDEWVVAKLVFDITMQFPGVVGRVADTDGEFLLIESAEALPDWVTPEDSDRRVFVVNGKLHIAPPAGAGVTRGKEGDLYDDDALQQVLDASVKTEASAAVQRLIRHKLDEVPAYLRGNRHRVRCLLPERAARVLGANRELASPAVEAFYYREPKQAGLVWGKMATFMPPGDGVVEEMVTLSRAMFAQLKQQPFFPPKPFLRRDERYRVLESNKDEENKHPDAQAADIGVKLACGLELLYAGRGEDQLGRPWKEVLEEALREGAKLSARPIEPDDDDSWLYVHPDTLESQLQRAAMAGASSAPGGADELQSMAAVFGKFVDGVSGVEGVEGAEPIQFDMSSFMEILKGHEAKGERAAGLDAPWGEHFMDDDEPSQSDSDDGSGKEGSGDDFALDEAMAEMEAELAGTQVAKSFARFEDVADDVKEASSSLQEAEAPDVGSASFSSAKPLDLDYNLLSNLLESFASQDGHAGPVSTILNEMNFPKPTP